MKKVKIKGKSKKKKKRIKHSKGEKRKSDLGKSQILWKIILKLDKNFSFKISMENFLKVPERIKNY